MRKRRRKFWYIVFSALAGMTVMLGGMALVVYFQLPGFYTTLVTVAGLGTVLVVQNWLWNRAEKNRKRLIEEAMANTISSRDLDAILAEADRAKRRTSYE